MFQAKTQHPELIIHVEDMDTEKAYIYYNVELVTSTVCSVISMIEMAFHGLGSKARLLL